MSKEAAKMNRIMLNFLKKGSDGEGPTSSKTLPSISKAKTVEISEHEDNISSNDDANESVVNVSDEEMDCSDDTGLS
ncbi:uncharacterized protein LOC120901929 isoform X2 [Anopheles arabiensis]|uniref:uncharacterized protein LOC120894538 isoform X2 n=1 Tax=Anopheles arabiensis TaxID=7173 RepID=UPI001AAC48F2|nr:uncharacterized protein LOC120894538 isoform X2 [Anopheles arabiensis]XP_040166229.1 uncharacterized protein LOC120901929 isoform X2 [Anopheles arabiensis]